jgi:hypothetical protein
MINYERIGKAQLFYKALGYANVETPWFVSQQACQATLPPDRKQILCTFGSLVGSGEQGFIQQMLDGTLEAGKYQTTTPCFRDEPEYNELTRQAFMKVELIWYMPDDPQAAYETVLNDALTCHFTVSHAELIDALQTDDGFDLMYNKIEIGSYGIRKMDKHIWVYGTGLAEPRFSLALLIMPAPVPEPVVAPAPKSELDSVSTADEVEV